MLSCDKKLASAVVFEIEQRLIADEIIPKSKEFDKYLRMLDGWLKINKLSGENISKVTKKRTEVLLRYLRLAGYLPADLLPLREMS